MEELILKYQSIYDEYSKKTKILFPIGLALVILGFVGFFVFLNIGLENPLVFIIISVVLIAAGIIILIVQAGIRKKWSTLYKKEIFPEFLKATYPDGSYYPDRGFDLEKIMYTRFFRKPDRYLRGNYLSAKIGTTEFEMADYTFQMEHRDKDGHITYDTYAKGRFLIMTFPRNFKSTVKVLEKTFKFNFGFIEKKHVVEMESVDFNKKFTTYCDDSLAAFYILTPQIQEKMLELEASFKGQIYYLFDDNHLYVAINDNGDSFTYPLGKAFDVIGLNDAMKELLIPKTFIELLKLNADKFSEESFDNTI